MLQTDTNSQFPECVMKVVGFQITLKEGCLVYFEVSFLEESLKEVYGRKRDAWAIENGTVNSEQRTAQ